MRRLIAASVAALCLVGFSGFGAWSADMPLKAPPALVDSSYFYFSGDGTYNRVRLPTYGLGFQFTNGNAPANPATGATDSYDPRAEGAGGNLRLGYAFRDGTFAPVFGTNVRIEIGGSYIDANANQSGSSPPQGGCCGGNGIGYVPLMLNGTFTDDFSCAPATPCSTSSTLATHYRAGRAELKALSDFRSGVFTFTPSALVFAGQSTTDQLFRQANFNSFLGINEEFYAANTRLRWTDWGAMVGLSAKVDPAPWLTASLGAKLGFAGRDVSLNGNDTYVNVVAPFTNTASSISVGSTTVPFLANVEGSVGVRPMPNVLLRAFAGLDYDSRVPGILAPTAAKAQLGNAITTPAGIKFAAETGYYAGAGLTVTFGPGR